MTTEACLLIAKDSQIHLKFNDLDYVSSYVIPIYFSDHWLPSEEKDKGTEQFKCLGDTTQASIGKYQVQAWGFG